MGWIVSVCTQFAPNGEEKVDNKKLIEDQVRFTADRDSVKRNVNCESMSLKES